MLCCKRCHVLDSWRTYWKQGNHHDESLKEMWSRLLEAMELWKSSIGSLFFVISSCQCLALPGIKKCLALPSDDWQCKMPKLCWLKVFWGTKLYLSEQGLTELGFSKFGVRAPLPWSLNSIILKGWSSTRCNYEPIQFKAIIYLLRSMFLLRITCAIGVFVLSSGTSNVAKHISCHLTRKSTYQEFLTSGKKGILRT